MSTFGSTTCKHEKKIAWSTIEIFSFFPPVFVFIWVILNNIVCKFKLSASKGFLSSPKCPNRFWGPPSLPFSWSRELFPGGKNDRLLRLTTYLYLVSRFRMSGEVLPPPPMYLHGVGKESFTQGSVLLYLKTEVESVSETSFFLFRQ